MAQIITNGRYWGTIEGAQLQKSGSSEAACITGPAKLTHIWDPAMPNEEGGKGDWRPVQPVELWYSVWIVKKDGEFDDKKQKEFAHITGWDGLLKPASIAAVSGTSAQFQVKDDTYEGETTSKIAWVLSAKEDPTRRQIKGGSQEDVDDIVAKYAAIAKAKAKSAGLVKEAAPAPPVTPASAPPPPPPPPPAASDDFSPAEDDDIPF